LIRSTFLALATDFFIIRLPLLQDCFRWKLSTDDLKCKGHSSPSKGHSSPSKGHSSPSKGHS
jgi:hypothetical protein